MYIQSPYPALPHLPEVNVHNVMFGRANQAGWVLLPAEHVFTGQQAEWPDYTIHIEAKTGRERTYKELMNDIAVGATALGASVSAGGLGLNGDGDEIIGILGDNSLVCGSSCRPISRLTDKNICRSTMIW